MAARRFIGVSRVQQPWNNLTNFLNYSSLGALPIHKHSPQWGSHMPSSRECHNTAFSDLQSRILSSCLPVGGRRAGTAVTLAGSSGALGRWGQLVTRSKYKAQDSDDEDSDDESDDDVDFGPHFEEDNDFPDNYKELKKHASSLRADAILGGGLNLARKKVDDYFLESKLLLNGKKVLKKSKQMEPGDCIDLITEVNDDTLKVKRVRLVKVAQKKSSKDRHLLYLRAWRSSVSVPRDESTKWTPPR